MDMLEQNENRIMDENNVLNQLMELLEQQNMGTQKMEFMELFHYVAGMQNQLRAMLEELQGVRKELAQMQEKQPQAVVESHIDKVENMQARINSFSKRLSAVKNRLVETAAQAVKAFKEKGKEGMCKVLHMGISGVKKMLTDYRENLVDEMADFKKKADRIDKIGNELKQIGYSVYNVGRLMTGRNAKEVSTEKIGVGLTRAINAPIKKEVDKLEKSIGTVDKALKLLDRLSESIQTEKETEKSERASVKDKLSHMKEKADRQKKAPEPDKAKGKGKEKSL